VRWDRRSTAWQQPEVIKMREPDGTQLPLVETFGEELERAIANRAGSRRRSQRRLLSLCAAGLLAVSLLTPPGRAASGLVGEWLGIGEPGGPPSLDVPRPRGMLQKEPIRPIVLSAGRAPDGVRFEFVLESFAEPARSDPPSEDFRYCLNLEWPDAAQGQISPQFGCYRAFPPAVLDRAVVKRGGLIFDNTYTTHVQIAGLARYDVARVRILYKDEHGAKRDAQVHFARVAGPVRERAGADRPVGVFIGFLPPAWLGYGASHDPRPCPPEQRPYDPDAIEVIAYDDEGQVIAREVGNNLLSLGGRPCR
jgi:hypothetical protein